MNSVNKQEPPKNLISQALEHLRNSNLEDLKKSVEFIINNYPNGSTSWLLLGIFYNIHNKLDEATEALQKCLKINNNYAEGFRMLADVERKKANLSVAISMALKAKELRADDPNVLDTLGTCYAANKQHIKAEESFNEAIKITQDKGEIFNNLGNSLKHLGKYDEAIESFNKALKLIPKSIEVHTNFALVYFQMKEYDKALSILNGIIENHNPINKSSIYSVYGHIYKELHNSQKAEEYFLKSLDTSNPQSSDVNTGLANIYLYQRKYDKALKRCEEAFRNSPLPEETYSNYIMTHAYIANKNYEEIFKKTKELANKINYKHIPMNYKKSNKNKKIRVGFISGDFYEHALSFFLLKPLSFFNDDEFLSIAYYNHYIEDRITKKLKEKFRKWRDIVGLSTEEKVSLILKDNLDILIDLSGHTARGSIDVLKAKPAPIQMTWLGYNFTTGLKEVDYIITDNISMPENEEKWFVEKPIKMQKSFYCFSEPFEKLCKLEKNPNKHFVYGSFTNSRKLNDDVLIAWRTILKNTENSKLYLKSQGYRDKYIADEIYNFFEKENLGNKLIFETDSSRDEYLLKYNEVDLILDTFPYPGGTTTCEALYMGTPVLTLKGYNSLSRNGENILLNTGLNDFVASSLDEYINFAINFKNEIHEEKFSKGNIRKLFLSSDIMNGEKFTTELKSYLKKAISDNK